MAKIFKPRRALRSSVKSGSKRTLVLASGEMMLVGKTAIGEGSKADLYLGDGVSQIQNLAPAMYGDTSEEDITITDDSSTTATAALGNVTSGAKLGNILGSLKKAISLNASAIATLNDDVKSSGYRLIGSLEANSSGKVTFPNKVYSAFCFNRAPGANGLNKSAKIFYASMGGANSTDAILQPIYNASGTESITASVVSGRLTLSGVNQYSSILYLKN